jgi:hypothetical protein
MIQGYYLSAITTLIGRGININYAVIVLLKKVSTYLISSYHIAQINSVSVK